MIITVTLNAAIDKSLSVPNFRLGQRHRAVELGAVGEVGEIEKAADDLLQRLDAKRS